MLGVDIMEWCNNLKVVIFDLDGTLYIDREFYKRYISYLVEGTKWERYREDILINISSIFNGDHQFKVGNFYKKNKNNISKGFVDISELFAFQGYSDKQLNITDLSSLENTRYIYGGDAWSIVSIISSRMGISEEKRLDSFVRIRKEMLKGDSFINRHNVMLSALSNLSCQKKILMTNTPVESAKGFVEYLEVEQYFDEIHYGSEKPKGLIEVLNRLVDEEGIIPDSILSIGDHVWNDLYPVKNIGGKAVLVSPYKMEGPICWDYYVSDLDLLAELLISIEENK